MFKKSLKFFEGNKFSRLNHYGFALRSITASGLLTVSLVAPCLLHAGDLPYYRTELCKSVDQAKLREDVKTSIMTLNDKLPEMGLGQLQQLLHKFSFQHNLSNNVM